MKELALLCIVLHLSFSHALTKKADTTEFSTISGLAQKIKDIIVPNDNTLAELEIPKNYYPENPHHLIKKRNVGEPAPDGSSKRRRKKRRRRKKKVPKSSPSTAPETSRPVESPTESQLFPPSEAPVSQPVDNVLDPSEGRRRRRKKKRPVVEPPPVLEEEPILSELSRKKESTDGLLRAKQLQAKHIQTDMMNANRLKADRIKADRVQAVDVIVTAGKPRKRKSRRRPKPVMEEFVQPGPMYERAGTQRFNSVVDHSMPESNSFGLMGQPTYDQNMGATLFDRLAALETNIPTEPQMEQLFSVRRKATPRRRLSRTRQGSRRRITSQDLPPPVIPGISYQLPLVRSADLANEFSSGDILKQYTRTPKLSEFVAESTPFQYDFTRKFTKNKQRKQRFDPSKEFHLFDKQTAQVHEGTENTAIDSTSKTYMSNTDPWYFR